MHPRLHELPENWLYDLMAILDWDSIQQLNLTNFYLHEFIKKYFPINFHANSIVFLRRQALQNEQLIGAIDIFNKQHHVSFFNRPDLNVTAKKNYYINLICYFSFSSIVIGSLLFGLTYMAFQDDSYHSSKAKSIHPIIYHHMLNNNDDRLNTYAKPNNDALISIILFIMFIYTLYYINNIINNWQTTINQANEDYQQSPITDAILNKLRQALEPYHNEISYEEFIQTHHIICNQTTCEQLLASLNKSLTEYIDHYAGLENFLNEQFNKNKAYFEQSDLIQLESKKPKLGLYAQRALTLWSQDHPNRALVKPIETELTEKELDASTKLAR